MFTQRDEREKTFFFKKILFLLRVFIIDFAPLVALYSHRKLIPEPSITNTFTTIDEFQFYFLFEAHPIILLCTHS